MKKEKKKEEEESIKELEEKRDKLIKALQAVNLKLVDRQAPLPGKCLACASTCTGCQSTPAVT